MDTCILVNSAVRDMLLELARQQVFRPIWSEIIEGELRRVLLGLLAKPGLHEADIEAAISRLTLTMNTAFPDAQVNVGEAAINFGHSNLPDPNDEHIIQAAILGRADVIVTFNLKDFPEDILPGDLFSQHPDDFLLDILDLPGTDLIYTLNTISARTGRKGPKLSPRELLKRLGRDCPQFARQAERALACQPRR